MTNKENDSLLADFMKKQNIRAKKAKENTKKRSLLKSSVITETLDISIVNQKIVAGFFEFDVMAKANDSIYFSGSIARLNYNTNVFGSNIAGFGKITLTNGVFFPIDIYETHAFDISNGTVNISLTEKYSLTSWNRTYMASPKIILHVRMEILPTANNYGNLQFTDVGNTSYFSMYTLTRTANESELKHFDVTNYINPDNFFFTNQNPVITTDLTKIHLHAGLNDTLVVQGNNFGSIPGKFYFTDANFGNLLFAINSNSDTNNIKSWTNTQIVVKVPSEVYFNNRHYVSGTGQIKIETIFNTSLQSNNNKVNVDYAITNLESGGVKRPYLAKLNCINGFQYTLHRSVNDAAKINCFEQALADWSATLGVELSLERDALGHLVVVDTIKIPQKNIIYIDSTRTSGMGEEEKYKWGGTNFYEDFANIRISPDAAYNTITKTVIYPWNYNVVGTIPTGEASFYQAFLHELGHKMGLAHVIDTTALMYASIDVMANNRQIITIANSGSTPIIAATRVVNDSRAINWSGNIVGTLNAPNPPIPTITASNNPLFFDGSIDLVSSYPANNTWFNGATSPIITAHSAGDYTVIAKQDGCSQTSMPFILNSISGNVNLAGVMVNYNIGQAVTSDINGNYSFLIPKGWSGTVTPSLVSYAFVPANRLYNNVISNQTQMNYVVLQNQTITFGSLPVKMLGDAPFTIPATGGGSGNPVTFTSSDPTVATCTGINGSTITVLKSGTCVIYANQAGNASYNSAPQVQQTLAVNFRFDFSGSTGGIPNGSLISDGTYLYGMTYNGGSLNKGVIFKLSLDGASYTKLLDFDGTKGANPYGSLLLVNNGLYGLAYNGGVNNKGTAFKINTDGTLFTKLVDFDGTTKGSNPYGDFTTDGTDLYATTYTGGTNGKGTVIKMTTAGVVTKLVDFDGATKGSNPKGSLVLNGGYLYGMTYYGGSVNMGAAFKVTPAGTSFAKILDFNGYTLPNAYGSYPFGSFATDGTYLYGMTSIGGTKNKGTAFKIAIATNAYTKLADLDNTTKGSNPQGTFVIVNGFLYGLTYFGGLSNKGILYKIEIATNTFTKLLDFDGLIYGSNPTGSLLLQEDFLYGMTTNRVGSTSGTVFRYYIGSVSPVGNNRNIDVNAPIIVSTANADMQSVNIADDVNNKTFRVFPNPASGSVNYLYYSETASRNIVKILDLQGRVIQQEEIELSEGINNKSINISNLNKGIYFVSVGTKIQKLVIE